MSTATFNFHGLYPDVTQKHYKKNHASEQGISIATARIVKVVFDVGFEDQFHSHLLAEIEQIKRDEQQYFEVRQRLPFICNEFPDAAIYYYNSIIDPQDQHINHDGPKGLNIASSTIVRSDWSVTLSAQARLK